MASSITCLLISIPFPDPYSYSKEEAAREQGTSGKDIVTKAR
jgi:hypothetical protein